MTIALMLGAVAVTVTGGAQTAVAGVCAFGFVVVIVRLWHDEHRHQAQQRRERLRDA